MINSLKAWLSSNRLAIIIVLLYLLIAAAKITHPGVNNDQLMFVNAATRNPDNMFLWKSFHGFPTMIFPYIGALKSYLYMPIFYLFGVSIWSIRLPQLVLLAASLFLLYKALVISSDKKVALLAILFLGLDPSLIAHSRVDTGPVVLEFFLKVLAVYLLFLYLSSKKIIFFFSIFLVLALGIFNKLNFIWFVNALAFSFILFYGKKFYQELKNADRFYPVVITLIPYLLLIRFFIKLSKEVSANYKDYSSEVALANIPENISHFYTNLTSLVNGNQFFEMLYGNSPTNLGGHFSGLVFLIIIFGFIYTLKKYKSERTDFLRSYYFFVGMALVTALQILLTKRATAAWHVISIYPFLTIILAVAIFQISSLAKKQNFHLFYKLGILGLVFYQIAVNYLYITNYGKPTKTVALTSTIYDLVDYAKENRAQFICLDVDICNQLLSLTQEVGKYKEPFAFLDPDTYPQSLEKLRGNLNNPEGSLYVSHGSTNTHFPAFRTSFFEYIEVNKINLGKIKEFYDGDIVVFEIYKVASLRDGT